MVRSAIWKDNLRRHATMDAEQEREGANSKVSGAGNEQREDIRTNQRDVDRAGWVPRNVQQNKDSQGRRYDVK